MLRIESQRRKNTLNECELLIAGPKLNTKMNGEYGNGNVVERDRNALGPKERQGITHLVPQSRCHVLLPERIQRGN